MLGSVTRRDPNRLPSKGPSEWLAIGAIAVGGALGALLRFGFTRAMISQTDFDLWAATAASNVLGAFALGIVLVRIEDRPDSLLRPFLATGLLGSFTTFSTLLLENSAFFQASPAQATLHLVGIITLGLLAFPAGEAWGRRRTSRVRS